MSRGPARPDRDLVGRGRDGARVGSGLVVAALLAAFAQAADVAPDFERDVAPILKSRCLTCHDAAEKAGGLDLSSRLGLSKGGESGPAIVPGRPEESHLVERIASGEMPPKKQGRARTLPGAERILLERWIAAGAPWREGRTLDLFESTGEDRAGRDWWSLRPIRRAATPAITAGEDAVSPIDAYILQVLKQHGLTMAPAADRRTLIRRVCLDLVGIPPTFDEIERFAADPSPDAYEHLVDRLLASPHHGERWGRHWLDVARYAETCGYERDQTKPHAWKYRDWVVRALNDDRPFDRFILEQLAGDELPDRSESTIVATGFLRLGTWNDEPNDPQEYKYERLEDMVHATSTAFLGMTIKCARCHDHKFDPIRQADYYRMASAFWAGYIEPGPREFLGGPDAKALGHDVLGWTDRGREVPPLHLLKKGDPTRPGPVVDPGHQSMLPSLDRPFDPPPPGAGTTRRRIQLARWIADARNPLTARVWVNRLWQHHFGEGLVRSPDNFGFTGEKPTHPELLDWLASELISGGWKTKPIHRLILLSRAYRQSSIHPDPESQGRVDAGNRFWWHAERRRLDAEALRDRLLFVAGRLDANRLGGPSFLPNVPADALEGLSMKEKAWTPSPEPEQLRRGVYVFAKRGLLPPLLTTFDLPDTTLPCGRRDVTLVAPQALALLNNEFVHEQSRKLAERVFRGPSSPEARVRDAWRAVLGREPRPSEIAAAIDHLGRQKSHFDQQSGDRVTGDPELLALASLCHVLVNSNEFLYVD
ncbi:MAG: PSD1 and planctomycete cytochrome C domain-containing protein [Isosphaeraceae bacterium]